MEVGKFMESNHNIALTCLWLFLVASLICTVSMLVILIKKGDERKRHIIGKSGLVALIAAILLLILNIIWIIFFEANSRVGFESSPIIYLGFMSIVFNVSYFITCRKYR